ncbi:D-sedoheptulose 7-phosphate isomerase [Marinilactibacillus piezotolerans]|uniref:D-sedoheptulose 7-phosphate isomerase n=1 Tax=Marinilactibacillus piezotolerans TaxID=258723 RepID=A0A1I3ZVA0_9LACT|nr:SIS domain-containing protein [Marinilactibacillus piezotolerans]SFK48025.1 D-sedoheptulose 7-phosphate isomerase [Marinilactibacillus piezotolerans]
MSFTDFMDEYRKEYLQTLLALDAETIENIMNALIKARDNNHAIYVLGNGGSAASASHWVCDFNKGTNKEGRPRFKMMCLSDNIPIVTALGNDISYDDIYVEQLKNFLLPGDVVIVLSVSGASKNLVKAVHYGNEHDAETISIIGNYNGGLIEMTNETLVVPSENYGIVEDVHMYLAHVISQYLYEKE